MPPAVVVARGRILARWVRKVAGESQQSLAANPGWRSALSLFAGSGGGRCNNILTEWER